MDTFETVMKKEIVYEGEDYTRDSLENMVKTYQQQHETTIAELGDLKKKHDEIASEMNKDIAKEKSAWAYISGIVKSPAKFSTNLKGLLEKIPVINEIIPDRPISELLREKIEVAETRTKEVSLFLDKVETQVEQLRLDITRLNKKMIIAAQNEEKAAGYVLELKDQLKGLEKQMELIQDKKSIEFRQKEAEITELKQIIWTHGAKLRLFSNAEDRLVNIIKMNNNFLEILSNLHANMVILYETGNEVLDELRGNLSGLATVAHAGELAVDMQDSMQSLKASVNKVATLASQTSLYLNQNLEQMLSKMQIYDEETQTLIESNLEAEREIKEKRIDDTIKLAQKEFSLLQDAKKAYKIPEPVKNGK